MLDVDLPEITFRKGFLAQAKRDKIGHGMGRLRAQSRQMLEITPDSFVFVYGKSGVEVLPALLFADGSLGLRHADSWELGRFFAAHFASFIGDPRLGVQTRMEFSTLVAESEPREMLVVTASLANREID
ncbi:MAG: hypothetical protein ACXVRV_10795 [Gaiellaceae bacterium]